MRGVKRDAAAGSAGIEPLVVLGLLVAGGFLLAAVFGAGAPGPVKVLLFFSPILVLVGLAACDALVAQIRGRASGGSKAPGLVLALCFAVGALLAALARGAPASVRVLLVFFPMAVLIVVAIIAGLLAGNREESQSARIRELQEAAIQAAAREWSNKPRACPRCGKTFTSVQDMGQCPDCAHLFYASHPDRGREPWWEDIRADDAGRVIQPPPPEKGLRF